MSVLYKGQALSKRDLEERETFMEEKTKGE